MGPGQRRFARKSPGHLNQMGVGDPLDGHLSRGLARGSLRLTHGAIGCTTEVVSELRVVGQVAGGGATGVVDELLLFVGHRDRLLF